LGGECFPSLFSSHNCTWFCFCPWSVCNLVLAKLQ
jgi:Zn-finger protein